MDPKAELKPPSALNAAWLVLVIALLLFLDGLAIYTCLDTWRHEHWATDIAIGYTVLVLLPYIALCIWTVQRQFAAATTPRARTILRVLRAACIINLLVLLVAVTVYAIMIRM